MNRQQTTFLLYSPLTFIKVVMMLCISLVAGACLLNPTYVEAAPPPPVNLNCTLIVPANPLSANGLATPYQLVATDLAMGPCHEANPAQSAFVQGAILNLATGQISVYDPLVIDKGTEPAINPVVPTLPEHALVALWFGFNGNILRLQRNDGFRGGMCVDGLDNISPFGQFAYCNAPKFFEEANEAIDRGVLVPPPLGRAADGLTCPSTRDFSVVDQDQSDNVTTTYLALGDGRTAQDTAANRARLGNFTRLVNPSDNKLLVSFIDPALDCDPWMRPNLADQGRPTTALPLNELQAAKRQEEPVALVPAGDPMVLVNGQPNRDKLNLFRVGVDQPQVANLDQASTVTYCRNLADVAPERLRRDERLFRNKPSPNPAMNLFDFLVQRFRVTWGPAPGLNCVGLLHRPSPL